MGILGILIVYLLMQAFMHERWVALFAAFLYAVLPVSLYRGMAGEWRGGVFVVVFVAIALLFIIKTDKKTAIWTVPGALLFIIASLWFWSGGVYVLLVLGLYLASAMVFYALPRLIKRTGSNHLLRNWLTYIVVFALLPIGYLVLLHVNYTASLINGYFSFELSYIEELAPTTAADLFIFFAWVFPVSIMGLGLIAYMDRRETFHKSQYALFSLFVPTVVMASIQIRWLSLFAIPACIYAAYFIYAFLTMMKARPRIIIEVVVFLSALALLAGLYFMLPITPADGINYQFLTALSWLKANSPANATVLTLWPDGSLVEGYADRPSYSDSIMGMGTPESSGFIKFLFRKAGNYSYIYSVRPSYLPVRKYWLNETFGMLIQIGLPLNTSVNGTNLQQLLQLDGKPPFPVVFSNNDTIIYKT